MSKNLVIVESPAKAKTIEKFLGKDFKVLSSFGHIRDLKKKDFSIDVNNHFEPIYEIPSDKKKIVAELNQEAEKAEIVWLASDEDREGEAIAWHLYETLKLTPDKTKRIVFHEITQKAILNAIDNPRSIDQNLVNAQQARRVLDRIVGFELSPVLWRRVKPALSAGRVQSVTVKLIAEREREVNAFVPERSFRVVADFMVLDALGKHSIVRGELSKRFKTEEEAKAFLEHCQSAQFAVEDVSKKASTRTSAPPFTTSTLQQEAARKLNFSVLQTMRVAQKLYESGYITYMRTDSVNLSSFALQGAKDEILSTLGEKYLNTRNYKTKAKGAQEAHEAIRPTYLDKKTIEGTAQEKRLYELIWKRTIASQMSDAIIEKTAITVGISHSAEKFMINGEVIVFDGFLHLYIESNDDENSGDDKELLLPNIPVNTSLQYDTITATERYSQQPSRYSEASLVRKLEELGIGRPSTYAPTISTIQQRDYVVKGDKVGEKRVYSQITISKKGLKEERKEEVFGREKGKLLPTDVGLVVNDFLDKNFPDIMNYQFTANVEKQFDLVAEGEMVWNNQIADFYTLFHQNVETVSKQKSDLKIGERVLGNDPKSGRLISVKIGRFGPMLQMGSNNEQDKPTFASLLPDESIETITLEQALRHFELPRNLGSYNDEELLVSVGKYGPYVKCGKSYVSLPATLSPMHITKEEAIELFIAKQKEEQKKQIKCFETEGIEILNGRYGPYIAYKGKNYKIPKGTDPSALTLEQSMELINKQKK